MASNIEKHLWEQLKWDDNLIDYFIRFRFEYNTKVAKAEDMPYGKIKLDLHWHSLYQNDPLQKKREGGAYKIREG